MKIEKTLLIEFDELREEQRLLDNFKGPTQKTLLKVLDYFVADNWEVARAELAAMPREMQEFVHPVVFDVLSSVHAREENRKVAPGAAPNAEFNLLADFKGLPRTAARMDYPKFKVLDTQ